MAEQESSPCGLPSHRFEGREAFRQLVRDALVCAAREGWRELILCDATLMRHLADRRRLEAAELQRATPAALELLATWCEAGWLHETGAGDG